MDINATIFGQTIAFIVFVAFCMKYVWPPIIAALEERQNKIAEGLSAADNATKDLEIARQQAADIINEAKGQAAEIVDRANKRHNEIVERAKTDAETEADKVKAAARNELDQELNRARDTLKLQLADLVVSGAEKIIERDVDKKAHGDIIDKLVANL